MSCHDERRNEITGRIVELTAQKAEVEPGRITPATHFVNDLNFDSLEIVELTMAVEDEVDVTVRDEDQDRLQTVGQVIDYLNEELTQDGGHPDSPSDAKPPNA